MRNQFMKTPWVVVVALAGMASGANTGTISGTVVAGDGSPIGRALVQVYTVPTASVPEPVRYSVDVRILADGSFEAGGLADGAYRVCASVPGSDYVEPCLWDKKPYDATVEVMKGGTVKAGKMVLETGVRLKIQVQDGSGLLTTHEGKTQGAYLSAGRWYGAAYLPCQIAAVTSALRECEILAPADQEFEVGVVSPFYALADEKGKAVDAKKGLRVKVTVKKGVAAAPVVVRVTGVK